MKTIKDKIYYFLVDKNIKIRDEFITKAYGNDGRKKIGKIRTILLVIRLNIKYRILRKEPTIMPNHGNVNKSNTKEFKHEVLQNGRIPVQYLSRRLLKYDVVSFDIFDTLIFRSFSTPKDILTLLGEKHNIFKFYTIRRECEFRVRERKKKQSLISEVTFEEIYEEIEKYTGLDKNIGMQAEIDLELELIKPNPYMLEVFNILKSNNKKIILTSDMYLPKDAVESLVKKCGYSGYIDLLVSSEYGQTKGSGDLYNIVKEKYPNQKIIHVGDSHHADVEMAKKHNIESIYYSNVNVNGKKYRPKYMSRLIGSAYEGIVNRKLHNGLDTFSHPYEYGYVYGGIYVLGFMNYVKEYCKKNGITKILFVARDGKIYKKVFEEISSIENEYLLYSRITHVRINIKNLREHFTTRAFKLKANTSETGVDLIELLESLDLPELINIFPKDKVGDRPKITKDNYEYVIEQILENFDMVINKYSKYEKPYEDYLRASIGEHKNIAIVDVGWTGTGVTGLSNFIKEKINKDIKVHNLLAGMQCMSKNESTIKERKNEIVPYLFSHEHNRNFHDALVSSRNGFALVMFEIFTQDTIPSFTGIDENGKFKFSASEVENYEFIKEIHRGIFDFSKEYISEFKNYPYMLNISGYDAFLPYYTLLSNNRRYLDNLANHLVFMKFLSGNAKSKLEKIK